MNLPIDSIDLSAYTPAELLRLRERLYENLPLRLSSLNLEEELVAQLHSAKALLVDCGDAPANQRAQVSNTITAVLKQIVDMQIALTTTETIKRMERILLATLKKYPDLQEPFLAEYEESLAHAN